MIKKSNGTKRPEKGILVFADYFVFVLFVV